MYLFVFNGEYNRNAVLLERWFDLITQRITFEFRFEVQFADIESKRRDFFGEPIRSLKMARILAVDDARVMRDLVKAVLEDVGHQVTTADDGTTAMDFARKQSVDLVITDINMPHMSGISLISKLRRLPAYTDTPILMLTTESEEYKKNKAKSLGADGWIQKPIDQERLKRAVDSTLQRFNLS